MENEISVTIAHWVGSAGNRRAVGGEEGRVRVRDVGGKEDTNFLPWAEITG